MRKVNIGVIGRFLPDGGVVPITILWEDGRKFEIDYVLDVCRAASLKVGGVGYDK